MAAAFSATYSDWKLIRTRKCVQVVFEIPLEAADAAYQVLGGMPDAGAETWFGIAKLKPGATEQSPVTRERRDWADIPMPQQAALRCNDPIYRAFLRESRMGEACDPETAAVAIRNYCGVGSRSEIRPGTEAEELWTELERRFDAWRIHDKATA